MNGGVPDQSAYFNKFCYQYTKPYVIRVDVIVCRVLLLLLFLDVSRVAETHLGHFVLRVDESNLAHL